MRRVGASTSQRVVSLRISSRRSLSIQQRNLIVRSTEEPISAEELEKATMIGEADEEAEVNKAPGALVDALEEDADVEAWYSAYDEEGDRELQERVIQIRRVTKVVKGGKQMSFRAVVIVGDEQGTVGVGVAAAKEVVGAVSKAVVDAKRNLIQFPVTRNQSIPHRIEGESGASKVMLRPATDGTGVVAGGATRVVLELAGLKNIFGKQLGASSPLNNARATIEGLRALKTFPQVAKERGITMDQLLGKNFEKQAAKAGRK